jgi:hypothetical protein
VQAEFVFPFAATNYLEMKVLQISGSTITIDANATVEYVGATT